MSFARTASRFGCFVVVWAAHVRAEPEHARVVLEYVALPERGCPDRDAFAGAIATRLGYEAVVPPEPDAQTLSVRFVAEKSTTRVTLRLLDPAKKALAEKTITSESCAELGSAAAFAAAILLDPRAMFPRPAKPPSEPAPVAPAAPRETLESDSPGTWPWWQPRSPLPTETPPSPAPRPSPPWRWRVGLAGSSCAGCAPALNAGGALFLGVAKGAIGLDAGARTDLPASTSNGSVRASLVLGELFPHVRIDPLRVGLLGSIGSLLGEGDGQRQSSLFAAAGLRAAVEWRVLAPLFLRAAIDGSLVLAHVSLRARGRELWSTPAVVGGASLGAGVEF